MDWIWLDSTTPNLPQRSSSGGASVITASKHAELWYRMSIQQKGAWGLSETGCQGVPSSTRWCSSLINSKCTETRTYDCYSLPILREVFHHVLSKPDVVRDVENPVRGLDFHRSIVHHPFTGFTRGTPLTQTRSARPQNLWWRYQSLRET